MPNIINADDGSVSGIAGIKQTADSSGALILQANGVNAISISNTAVVTISSSISGNGAGLTNINASNISSGTVATARLASGTANSSTYLRGDSTWAALSAPNNGTLTMNTSGTGISGSATFTADQSGNSTFTVASNANSANGASTIVARDSSGNFTANAVTLTTGSFAGGSNTAPSITFTGDTNTGIFSPTADTIAFTEGGVEAMRIDASGNALIGNSTDPLGGNRLLVQSAATANNNRTFSVYNTAATSTTAFANRLVQISSSGSGADATLHFSDQVANNAYFGMGSGALYFATGGTTERMRITSGGNVGIGNNNPSFSLDVLGGSGNNTMRLRGTGGSTTLRIDTDTDSASNRNWAFRNRYNAFGRLELMRGTTNSDDPLTTTMYWNNDGSTYVNGDFYFNSGYGGAAIAYGCRAWVNFNGLAGASIRASGNISSVTFVSTGNYTVNFTTAMPDANYCVTACNSGSFGANWGIINVNITGSGATEVVPTTSSFAVEIVQPSTARIDSKYIHLAVFR